MACNSVLRSARTAIAAVQVAFAELFAATGEAGYPAERRSHLAAFGHSRAGRLAANGCADTFVAGASPVDAVDLGVGRGRQGPLQRGRSFIVSCTSLHHAEHAEREQSQGCRLSHLPLLHLNRIGVSVMT